MNALCLEFCNSFVSPSKFPMSINAGTSALTSVRVIGEKLVSSGGAINNQSNEADR